VADQLTRIVSLALRHKPELFAVNIDNDGWTSLASLASGLSARFPALSITEDLLRETVFNQTIERFEIREGNIRALYGHSLSHVSIGEPNQPPPLLFHATRSLLLPTIRSFGLVAKGRNGVHLTSKWEYALSLRNIHSRRGHRGVILAVRTADTALKGVPFNQATSHIWLSPHIPARFLCLATIGPDSTTGPCGLTLIQDNAARSRLQYMISTNFQGE
jgi:putative RNA 2'-phosphotransferase